jgi:hypothetical protein
MLRKPFALASALALLLGLAVARPIDAQGTRSDRAVYFTFSQPVALPGHTLPAGKYLFRLLDSQVNRNIVEVFNADGTQLQATFMTIAAERPDRPNDPEIRFIEGNAGSPAAIRTYWYPGERRGWEFIYPRAQAMQLARTTPEPILTTAQDTPVDKMSDAPLARVSGGNETAVDTNATPAAAAPVGTAVRGTRQNSGAGNASQSSTSTSAAPSASSTSTASAASSTSRASSADRDALPGTASSLPAVFLAGIIALAAAVALRRLRPTV